MKAHRTEVVADALEIKLLKYLRIQFAGLVEVEHDPDRTLSTGASTADSVAEARRLERLRRAVWELRQAAGAIGTIPSGYPRHIDFVMKTISALLPWYTRNLVRFGEKTSETVEVIAETVEDALNRNVSPSSDVCGGSSSVSCRSRSTS